MIRAEERDLLKERKIHLALLLIVLMGTLFRLWGMNQPWGTKDHYNYGGPFLSAHLFCLKQTPLEISKGIGHRNCAEETNLRLNPTWPDVPEDLKASYIATPNNITKAEDLKFYRNHPVTFLYMLWGTTAVLGESEWVYRLPNLMFSILNIYLAFLIGGLIWRDQRFALLAAFFQASFLGTIYYGTHVDFLGEYTVSFILLGTYLALRNRFWSAGAMGVMAGLMSWPGYFFFAPLLLVAIRRKRSLLPVFATGAIGVASGLAMIAFLHSNWDFANFLSTRLAAKEYGVQPTGVQEILTLPFRWLRNLFMNHSRLLSPLFFSFALMELLRFRKKTENNSQYIDAIILTSGAGLITSVVGYTYVMVHNFWFIIWIPAFSLLCAYIAGDILFKGVRPSRKLSYILALACVAFYPYGVYQSSLIHDVINSVLLGGTCLAFWFVPNLTKKAKMITLLIVALANFSQVINYRTEKVSQYEICKDALVRYLETGQTPKRDTKETMTQRILYWFSPVHGGRHSVKNQ